MATKEYTDGLHNRLRHVGYALKYLHSVTADPNDDICIKDSLFIRALNDIVAAWADRAVELGLAPHPPELPIEEKECSRFPRHTGPCNGLPTRMCGR